LEQEENKIKLTFLYTV